MHTRHKKMHTRHKTLIALAVLNIRILKMYDVNPINVMVYAKPGE